MAKRESTFINMVVTLLLVTGIAAAALYVAALINDEKKTQREVADIAGITEVTIRNRYKELIEKLNLEEKIILKLFIFPNFINTMRGCRMSFICLNSSSTFVFMRGCRSGQTG